MARRKEKGETKFIPLDAINEPKMLIRESLGSLEELQELAESIKTIGLIQPIVLVQVGERFDLVAGHRRLHAAKLARLVSIEAKVVEANLAEQAIIRWTENQERLQNTPYEEALHLKEMHDNLGGTQSELARRIGKSAAFVTQRLAILDGYECVRESLRHGGINFAQARELFLMPDEQTARQYLDIVLQGGANANMIRTWRNDIVNVYKKIESEEPSEEERAHARDIVRLEFRKCEICNMVTDPADLVFLKTCKTCKRTLEDTLQRLERG